MSLIRRLQERVQRADAELEQQQAEAAKRANAARELQDTAQRLQCEVDQSEKQLAVATEQFEGLKTQAAQLRDVLGNIWGRTDGYGSALNPPIYSSLITIEAAVADFPRVRKQLQSKVSLARSALGEFEQQHAA